MIRRRKVRLKIKKNKTIKEKSGQLEIDFLLSRTDLTDTVE
jgi:hypothetical protein